MRYYFLGENLGGSESEIDSFADAKMFVFNS